MTGCYCGGAEQDRVPHQSLLAWGSSLTHCKSMGKDYLNAKMLWSNRSPHLPHKRPNIYCNSQRTHTPSNHPPHTNKSHVLFCTWAANACSALLPGSLQAEWFMYAYFCGSVCFCKSLDNSFLCQKYKCKMRYWKKTPPVNTSSHTKSSCRLCAAAFPGPFRCLTGYFCYSWHDLVRLCSTSATMKYNKWKAFRQTSGFGVCFTGSKSEDS